MVWASDRLQVAEHPRDEARPRNGGDARELLDDDVVRGRREHGATREQALPTCVMHYDVKLNLRVAARKLKPYCIEGNSTWFGRLIGLLCSTLGSEESMHF